MHKAVRVLLLPLLVSLSFVSGAPASAAPPPPPASIVALGDSITQATNACCWYGNHPANSWSTGSAFWDGVYSHRERIRATLNPGVAAYNNSRAGARAADLAAQASAAVSQGALSAGPDYVTVLMGANDACTSSPSTMTAPETFRQQVHDALVTLNAGLPNGHVFVSSIPDIYRLWQIFNGSSTARFVWSVAGICQSMLSSSNTEQDRLTVRQRVVDFNTILGQECAALPGFCLYDGGATFAFQFGTEHVSRLDYFHPSLRGQADLAALTWGNSWWGGKV